MANASIVENRAIAAHDSNVNYEGLAQNFFQRQGYTRIRHESTFINLANFYKFSEYYICDILIIAHANNLEAAEELVPELDAECERCRRMLLRGKSFNRDLTVETHHFMTLHKPFVRFSYQRAGLPMGFSIRPLILIQEEGQWDYFSGQAARVDVASMDSETLLFYLERHRDDIRANHSALLDLKKYRYWRISNALLNYGHFPLIGFWVIKLIYAFFEAPFPFAIGDMVALTALLYGGFLGVTYLTYHLFQQSRLRELQEFAPNTPSPVQPVYTPEFEDNIELAVTEAPEADDTTSGPQAEPDIQAAPSQEPTATPEARIPRNIQPIQPSSTADPAKLIYRPRILNQIRKALNSHDSTQLNIQSQHLLRNVFRLILLRTQRDLPRCETLAEYLRLARQDPTINRYYDSLNLWVCKLDTKTPFAQDEIAGFKKFLLLFLNALQCLPADLKQTVETAHVQDQLAPAPIPTTPNNADHPNDQQLEAPPRREAPQANAQTFERGIRDLERHVARLPSPPPQNIPNPSPELTAPAPPSPNFEVATIPQSYHSEIAGLNSMFLNKMMEREKNGVYCLLLIDSSQPDTERVVGQFNSCVKDLDVQSHIHDLHTDRDPLLEREFGNTNPPAVVIGCGKNLKSIPYGERGDDERLHAEINSFRRRPRGNLSMRDKAEGEPQTQDAREGMAPAAQKIENGEIETSVPDTQDMEERLAPPVPSKLPPLKSPSHTILPPPTPPPIGEQCPSPQEAPVHEGFPVPVEVTETSLLSRQWSGQTWWHDNVQKFEKGSVLIDGSNVAYLLSDRLRNESGPRLACVYAVVDALIQLGIPSEKITFYFDANIEHVFKNFNRVADWERLVEHIQTSRKPEFRLTGSGIKTDTALVQIGERLHRRFIAIAIDRYRDQPDWFRPHRIGVMLDPSDRPLFPPRKHFIEAYYGTQKVQPDQRRRRRS